MKFEARTLQVLKNFSTINQSIIFKPGKNLATMSPTKTILAKARINDEIPGEFAIYDLSRFLGTMSLYDSPNLKINDKIVVIENDSAAGENTKYICAEASNIVSPPEKDIKFPNPEVEFVLDEKTFSKVQKALGVLSLPEIGVVGADGEVYLQAMDSKNPTGDVHRVIVGETESTFKFIFKAENLKIIPGDYQVAISSKGLSHFVGKDVEYWIAVEANSTFS